MTEQLSHHPEQKFSHEVEPEPEREIRVEHAKHEHEPHPHHKEQAIARLEKLAKEEAEYTSERGAKAHERRSQHEPVVMTKEIKLDAFKKTLTRVRHHLTPSERNFSKVIHKPLVDKVSTVGAQTVARPSGILGGGIVAFVGSSVLLYLSKTYGYTYNLFWFVVLFAGGFVVGMLFELMIRALFHKRQRS